MNKIISTSFTDWAQLYRLLPENGDKIPVSEILDDMDDVQKVDNCRKLWEELAACIPLIQGLHMKPKNVGAHRQQGDLINLKN